MIDLNSITKHNSIVERYYQVIQGIDKEIEKLELEKKLCTENMGRDLLNLKDTCPHELFVVCNVDGLNMAYCITCKNTIEEYDIKKALYSVAETGNGPLSYLMFITAIGKIDDIIASLVQEKSEISFEELQNIVKEELQEYEKDLMPQR